MIDWRKILSRDPSFGWGRTLLRGVAIAGILSLGAASFGQAPPAKAVGTVKSVNGGTVVVANDSGAESTVTFTTSARVVRAEPGQTDPKSMTPIQVSDIQVGDRIFARGEAGENGALVAASAMVMKKSDIAQKQQTESEEWRRGVGGIVKSVDASAGAIVVANSLAASGKVITVHMTPQTQILRYAPDSIKFDDAKPGTIEQIKAGDQLRARGAKSADGTEFNAQAIVSGAFRDIAGTVVSTDAANSSITVMDLATKRPVTVKVSSESQLRQLPQPMAVRLAMRLKGGSPNSGSADAASSGGAPRGPNGGSGTAGNNPGQQQGERGAWQGRAWGGSGGGAGGMQGGGYGRGGGAPDFQQFLSRMPAVSISDLKKGDAVMLVATEGSESSEPATITLLTGVEPILTASPNAGAAMLLSPWNLGGGGEAGGAGGDSSQ